jgi:SAM-dependent methyltransferase
MSEFSIFDQRGYRTVDARTGYSGWAATYERTVEDAMDLALLNRLTAVDWAAIRSAVDLGCGTGRTGVWLKTRGVNAIDGVDITAAMLDGARKKACYRMLIEADIAATGLPPATFDLAICCLVDEHLSDLRPIYREALRLTRPDGHFVIVTYHPQFIMVSGMPTHYSDISGEPIAVETNVHLVSDHVAAALDAGWSLVEMQERVIDEEWLALKPKWQRFRGHPISAVYVWRKPD